VEDYCLLWCDLACKECDALFSGTQGHVRFLWGLPSQEYDIKDRIKWSARTCLGHQKEAIGDPQISVLYAFDRDDDYSTWACEDCGTRYEAVAVYIENGTIKAVELFLPGDGERKFGRTVGFADILYLAEDMEWRSINL